ncbi:hypothetical protein [Lactococcus allomyrinae]|uniref:Uncharacterized protein n=1 Tax=Lactococcus allomyrinae TaxID=2419773 RepID=A0A387BHL2_9LACT|nr:hypothetical protein [Lactococcus allomyrinae]AYG00596.1 hypothetical protein D7I46_05505 [Lactococcus allomyrinae]
MSFLGGNIIQTDKEENLNLANYGILEYPKTDTTMTILALSELLTQINNNNRILTFDELVTSIICE